MIDTVGMPYCLTVANCAKALKDCMYRIDSGHDLINAFRGDCSYAASAFHADEKALKELQDTFGYGQGFLTVCLAYCGNDAQQVGTLPT